ncbi:indolepyruvate ferredoxin oxidoreductase subunit alpha [Chlorobium sp.]|jgi:photosystem P840 reaction center iron-sulfur protein|uniref:indolepyruvate ferredoxin oxidoreductase subunit alpha n=1 Tax=Chlorobium sp. TaxID=1095 RepID=UPI003C327D61|nr:4Fe-4S dicluster domain-containing protein [Chlorobiaceae bacterium]NTW94107.1 4Fe-4S dicluster domain-containing protein [Chlorobiaceae bacterium]
MAEPVKQPDISPKPAAPAAKAAPAAPKAAAPAAKQDQAKPKASAPKQPSGKPRLEALNVNLGRTGIRQESALPVKKAAPKPAPKPAPAGAKPAPGAKPAAPAAGAVPAAKGAPVAKPAVPRAKKHYFIIENLCVGCGLCLDKCPPKVNAIGYKFYGDVQEGGFRCYIDQVACISCSACFSGDECPSGALIEVLPDGQVLDFSYTPPERLDFDLRFLHRFHREVR